MFKKYPFTMQNGLKDCAAASVQMIVKYYKGYVSMDRLSEMLKTNRDGTTAYHIVEALKEIGFKAEGKRLENLEKTKIPFIANVIIENSYKHYLVVYEVTDKYILVADPATKIKKLSHEDFYKIWTGIILTMYPVKPLIKQNNQNIKFFTTILKPYRFTFVKIWLLSVIVIIAALICSFFFQFLIENDKNKLLIIALIFLIILFIKSLTDYFRNKILIKFINNLDKDLTEATFKQIIKLPYNYYHNHTTGEILSRLDDLSSVNQIISKILLAVFTTIPLTLLSGILLFYINKTLLIVILFIFTLYLIVLISFKKLINNKVKTVQIDKANLNSYMVEAVKGFETVKGLNIENEITKRFQEKNNSLINSNIKLSNVVNNQYFSKEMIDNVSQILILLIGIMLVNNGTMSLGFLITYTVLANLFLEPIKNIIDLDFEIKGARSALDRVKDLFINPQRKKSKHTKGHIEFKDVVYSFDDINLVLKGINLKIKEKNKVLITGKSGSGKSTLLKLLKGYFENYQGEILINGKNLNECSLKINYINQKEILFTGTVNDNLCLKGSKKLNKIKRVCHTDEIVHNNDLSYNMLLEEDGFNISGGQRQRIVLARSLQNFDILIIDEGLNQLDVNLERQILKKLFKKYINKTIIVISHRLDNLDLYDQYIKLEEGKITLNEERSD